MRVELSDNYRFLCKRIVGCLKSKYTDHLNVKGGRTRHLLTQKLTKMLIESILLDFIIKTNHSRALILKTSKLNSKKIHS